jgi:hypothetical protein
MKFYCLYRFWKNPEIYFMKMRLVEAEFFRASGRIDMTKLTTVIHQLDA